MPSPSYILAVVVLAAGGIPKGKQARSPGPSRDVAYSELDMQLNR